MNLLARNLINDFYKNERRAPVFYTHYYEGTEMVTVPHGPYERNYEVVTLAKNIMRHKKMMIAIDRRIAARRAAAAVN